MKSLMDLCAARLSCRWDRALFNSALTFLAVLLVVKIARIFGLLVSTQGTFTDIVIALMATLGYVALGVYHNRRLKGVI
jgi:hypothetical protein